MTANQIAILLAVYRGFVAALEVESFRANYNSDLRALSVTGMITSGPVAGQWHWHCTPKGDAVCKFILGALSDQPMPPRPF